MKKLTKQDFRDLEVLAKKVQSLDKNNVAAFTKELILLKSMMSDISDSISKELEKYCYCEACKSYHSKDVSKYFEEIRETDPGFGYYYDVCPICGNKTFIIKKLLGKPKATSDR